jgi:hypothetical protein
MAPSNTVFSSSLLTTSAFDYHNTTTASMSASTLASALLVPDTSFALTTTFSASKPVWPSLVSVRGAGRPSRRRSKKITFSGYANTTSVSSNSKCTSVNLLSATTATPAIAGAFTATITIAAATAGATTTTTTSTMQSNPEATIDSEVRTISKLSHYILITSFIRIFIKFTDIISPIN